MTSRIATACRLALVTILLSACSTPPWQDSSTLANNTGNCGPCCDKNPAAQASATQGISATNPTNQYTGKDTYLNVIVAKDTVLYALTPAGAPPGFAVTEDTLVASGGSLVKYYSLVQVTTDPGKDPSGVPRQLRDKVRAFHVMEQLCAARGTAKANPQFGTGGGTQYYVSPSDAGKLSPGKIRPI